VRVRMCVQACLRSMHFAAVCCDDHRGGCSTFPSPAGRCSSPRRTLNPKEGSNPSRPISTSGASSEWPGLTGRTWQRGHRCAWRAPMKPCHQRAFSADRLLRDCRRLGGAEVVRRRHHCRPSSTTPARARRTSAHRPATPRPVGNKFNPEWLRVGRLRPVFRPAT
jgi:hypothetical protein